MENIEKLLNSSLEGYGLSLTAAQTAKFQRYLELLLEWNEKVNLTAIRDPEEVAVKHFADSLLLLRAVNVGENAGWIDVGTGAGFPGVPLKIAREDIRLTLLDSLNKRLIFLESLLKELSLDAALVHERAEEGSRKPQLRERFDFASARAVAPLNILCEYCLPFLRTGGIFAAMKGPDVGEEVRAAGKAISLLGGKLGEIKKFSLPDGSGRSIVLIEKISATSDKYPRHGSKIAKSPL